MHDIAHILLIDRATRAVATRFGVFIDRATAEEWLGRSPLSVTETSWSWGAVSVGEVASLFDLTGDVEGLAMFREALEVHAHRDTFLSLHWLRKDRGSYGKRCLADHRRSAHWGRDAASVDRHA